jgi:murein DD-endopeptidase MepM/ murein hydrolase activator NlpD
MATINPMRAIRQVAASTDSGEDAPNILKPSDSLDRALASAAARTGRFLSRHPRKLTAVVTLALAGFGAAAFGVAPLVPDASDLPKRMVTENVAPQEIEPQLEVLAEHELQLYRNDLTRSSDTADTLLQRLNVNDPSASAFLRYNPIARKVLEGRSGKVIEVRTDATGKLAELVARYAASNPDEINTRFTRLRIQRVAGQLQASIETAPLAAQVRMGSGTVRSSLFAATDEARIPDAIATQLADVFAADIDFHRELRKGATFSIVYEALTADGEPITWTPAAGRILAAEFINGGKPYSAIWFREADGRGAYYGLDGQSKHRSFLASPLEFSRVTSGFEMRLHPILNTWKQHKGVDYGAPAGTPVRAVGDGTVEFAGWQNGYGNVVEIKHNAERSTVYAHLSRIAVTKGQHVEQGANIGAVGSTGWATGPHLHFEVKFAGVQQDPLQIAKASEPTTITPAGKTQFAQLTRGLKSQLQVAESVGRSISYGE